MKNIATYILLFFLTGCAWELPEKKGAQTCTIKPSVKIDKTAGNKLAFAVSLTSTDEVVSASYTISGPSSPTSTSPSGTTYSSQVTVTTGGTYNIEAKVTDKCGTTYAVTGSVSTDGCVAPTADLKINANADVKLTTITLENSTDVKTLTWKVNGVDVVNSNTNTSILSYTFERGKTYDIIANYKDNCGSSGSSKVTYTTAACSLPSVVAITQTNTNPVELTATLSGGNAADIRGDGVTWKIEPADAAEQKLMVGTNVVFKNLKAGTDYKIIAEYSALATCAVPIQTPSSTIKTSAAAVIDKTAWSIVGSSNDDGVTDMEVDDAGNIYICGVYKSNLDFGNGKTITTNRGDTDFFVAKFDTKGLCQWAVSAGSSGRDEIGGLVINNGDVYITGSLRGVGSFSGLSTTGNAGNGDIFVAKCSSNGSWAWTITRGGSQDDIGRDIQIIKTSTGELRLGVVGTLRGSGSFGFPQGRAVSIVNTNLFLTYAGLDGSGAASAVIWVSAGSQDVNSFTTSADQKVAYLTGKFSQSFNFNDPNYAGKAMSGSATQQEGFLYNWDPNIGTEWTAQAKSSKRGEMISICRGPDNALYTAGILDGTMNGGANNSSTGCFWAKYDVSKGVANDKTNAAQWSKGSGASSESYGKITYEDALVYAGQFQNTANLGVSGSQIKSNGNTDYFVVVIDPNSGNITKQFYGGGSGEDGIGKAISKNGIIYAVGSFTGSQNINGVNLTNTSGVKNTFIAKIKL